MTLASSSNEAGPSRLSASPRKSMYPVWPDSHDEAEYFEVPPDHFLAQQRGANKAHPASSSQSTHVRRSSASSSSAFSEASMPMPIAGLTNVSATDALSSPLSSPQPLSELATAVRAGIPALPSSLGHINQPLDRLADAVPRPAGFSTVDEQIPDTSTLAAADFDVDVRSGFLPPEAPVRRLGGLHAEHWENALDEAKRIPLMQGGGGATITQQQRLLARRWRRSLREMPVLPLSEELANDIRFARRGHVVLSFLAHFYIHSQPPKADGAVVPQRSWLNVFSRRSTEELQDEQDLVDELNGKHLRRVPAAIAVPWVQLSQKLDLPPVLTYATTVLWNWEYINPSRGLEADNIRIVETFTATPSEHHFFFTSLLIEARGVEALELMRVSLDEAFVADRVARRRIAGYLNRLAVVLKDLTKLLHDVRNGCDPKIFYWGIRPWFVGSDTVDKGEEAGWHFEGVDPEGVKRVFSGPSAGQSSMIHAIDVFLDVDHTRRKERLNRPAATATSDARGADATFMERMSLYMPGHHRAFLAHLRNISFDHDLDEDDDASNMSASVAGSDADDEAPPRELPHPIRSLALKAKTEKHDEGLPAAYDNALKELKGLRDEHMKVAYLYIVAQARGSPPDAYAPLPRGFTGQPDVDRRLIAKAKAKAHADAEAEADAMLDTNSKDNGGGAKGTGGTDLVTFLRDCRVNTIDALIMAKEVAASTAEAVSNAVGGGASKVAESSKSSSDAVGGTSSGQSTLSSPSSPQIKVTDPHTTASPTDASIQIWAVNISDHAKILTETQPRDLVTHLLPGPTNVSEREKVLKYYRQIDRIRSLVARLLPRLLLSTLFNIPWSTIRFSSTREGRPYLTSPALAHFDFNISHDTDWVVLAFTTTPRIPRVGVDVMAIQLPRYESSLKSFTETMDMALTLSETRWVLQEDEGKGLKRLYTLWTYKEAYTKNLGLGLGFDFSRIEFEFDEHDEGKLMVDGKMEEGYGFVDVLLPGPGVNSQVVVCHGPQESVEGQRGGRQITADEAENVGLLRRMTLAELLEEARAASGTQ